jgi:steroid delta-isomerase-like uncharacterized protein
MKAFVQFGSNLSAALLISMAALSETNVNHLSIQPKMETIVSPDSNKAIIRRLYEEILNTGKLELLDQVVADDYTGPRGIKGPLGFASAVKPVILAFPDIKWSIEDIIAEGDKVVVMWSWKGTNKNSFDGFPPTNKEVTHHSINIFQLSGGKIVNAWMQADRLGFYQQIGVISQDAVKPPVRGIH